MNIDIVGRIRPTPGGDRAHGLQIDSQNRIAAKPGAPYLSFQQLYYGSTSNYEVYKKSVEPLVDLCISGYNVGIIVAGESSSGKCHTLAGETLGTSGIVPILIDYLFTKVQQEDAYMFDRQVTRQNPRISLEMYEFYNELVRDLLSPPGVSTEYLKLDESAGRGVHVKNGKILPALNATDGLSLFRQGWARRSDFSTDFGPAQNNAATILHFNLEIPTAESAMLNKSRLTIVKLPELGKLHEDSSRLRLREGPNLSKGIIALNQLVTSLANQPFPDRVINYSESKLTQYLRDEIGGNFKTRVFVCLKPHCEVERLEAVLQFATKFSQVKNYPVLNDYLTQQLLTQYQARIINLQQQLGIDVGMSNPTQLHDVKEELRKIQSENIQLRDRSERLQHKLDQLQGNFGNVAGAKADLSQQLLMTEEEKLKISKTLVEMQIENNNIREEMEAAKFELTNKILSLENELMEVEIDKDKQDRSARQAKDRLREMEQDRKDLADEYVTLKTNYLTLTKSHEKEGSRNEELSVELLNLANAKAALMRQLENLETGNDPNAEIERVRAIISRLSSRKVQPEELYGAGKDIENLERKLLSQYENLQGQMERQRKQYEAENRKMEGRLNQQSKDLLSARSLARERQRKVAELTAQLITTRNDNDELRTLNNRMQHKIKDINDEYRSRLVKYVEDIAEHTDKSKSKSDSAPFLKETMEKMIKDLKKAHKSREQQLSEAAQNYKNKVQKVVKKHEELLTAYRDLRQQVETRGPDDLDLGPAEDKLQMSDSDLKSAQQKEINRLRSELEEIKSELGDDVGKVGKKNKGSQEGSTNWSSLRKQMREFTLNTQQELELERARLLSQNIVLEEQLKECQEYIDNNLKQQQDENYHLRQLLGMDTEKSSSSQPSWEKTKKKGRTYTGPLN